MTGGTAEHDAPPGGRRAWPQVASVLLLVQAVAAAVVTAAFTAVGLSVDGWSFAPPTIGCLVLYVIGGYLHLRRERLSQAVLAVAMVASVSLILSPAQYAAVAVGRPLIDGWLASADALIGVHVPDLAAWVQRHPTVLVPLAAAYASLLLQFILTPVVLLWYGREDRLWEFLFHFHACAVLTVTALAAYPAACAFQHYGFEAALDQTRFLEQFNGVRAARITVVDFRQLEGLISVPSFHVAGGLMCAWAVRGLGVFGCSALLNLLLVAATVLTGAHYAIDVPITLAMCGLVLWMWRALTPAAWRPATIASGDHPATP